MDGKIVLALTLDEYHGIINALATTTTNVGFYPVTVIQNQALPQVEALTKSTEASTEAA